MSEVSIRQARREDLDAVLEMIQHAGAQLAKLLVRESGVKVNCSILRYDGRPFDIDYLLERIKEMESRWI